MKIKRVERIQAARRPEDFPTDNLPEVAVGGRSNVGKSSFLNVLLRVRGLTTVSKRPGRTRELGFFRINEQFYLVDLPGYGYAEAPKHIIEKWGKLVEQYLTQRRQLAGLTLLLDLRHPPSAKDRQLFAAMLEVDLPLLLVGTKADKVPRGKRKQKLQQICRELELPEEAAPIPFSAQTGEGRDQVLAALGEIAAGPPSQGERRS